MNSLKTTANFLISGDLTNTDNVMNNTFWIGGIYTGGTNYYTNIDLSFVKVYKKAFSAAEVSQNFNALRGRYGI